MSKHPDMEGPMGEGKGEFPFMRKGKRGGKRKRGRKGRKSSR